MRIIGGAFKSRKLHFRSNPKVRPMTDRMKETLFDILGETVKDAKVLDLFAGSGSLGLEALSRGAALVVFIDSDAQNCRIIRENLDALNFSTSFPRKRESKVVDPRVRGDDESKEVGSQPFSKVIRADVFSGLKRLENQGEHFDLVFTDPPYNKGLMKKLLPLLDQSDILAPHARLVCHHSIKESLPETLTSLLVERSIKIGQARLSFLYRGI